MRIDEGLSDGLYITNALCWTSCLSNLFAWCCSAESDYAVIVLGKPVAVTSVFSCADQIAT